MNTSQPFIERWQWRYGFLAVLLLLFLRDLWDLPQRLHTYASGRFEGIILTLMLVLNHLAFWCVPAGRLRTVFRVLACAWVVFGCAYVFTRGFSGLIF